MLLTLLGKEHASEGKPIKLVEGAVLVDVIEFNGESYRVGDYVYVANPEASTRPTIIQISETWKQTKSDEQGISGYWFLRPEQTVHKASHKFMENEVFKTTNIVGHKVQDIIGRAYVLFIKDYIRGRPKGFNIEDVFVCESRYVEPGKTFAKIKNWSTCLPEKVRHQELDLILHDTPLIPAKVPSILNEAEKARKRKISEDVASKRVFFI